MPQLQPPLTSWAPIGPWVVVEQVDAMLLAGGALYRPWTARAPEAFVAQVLAAPEGVDDFERGDFLLVEKMSGHPGMAGEAPPELRGGRRIPGRTRVVDLDASLWGGTPGKPAGIVRCDTSWALGVPLFDEEAARRTRRGLQIETDAHEAKRTLDDELARHLRAEQRAHERWLREHEDRRSTGRRSRLMKPSQDPGQGEGVLAVITDADYLLRFGVDPVWLAGRLGIDSSAA